MEISTKISQNCLTLGKFTVSIFHSYHCTAIVLSYNLWVTNSTVLYFNDSFNTSFRFHFAPISLSFLLKTMLSILIWLKLIVELFHTIHHKIRDINDIKYIIKKAFSFVFIREYFRIISVSKVFLQYYIQIIISSSTASYE